ncbi:MAG: SagB/ThcOx family dehydrogenase [Ignisphaera sp.]
MKNVELIAYVISFIITLAIAVHIFNIIYGAFPWKTFDIKDETVEEGRADVVEDGEVGEVRIVGNVVYLPLPRRVSNVSVEEAILLRRSIREYLPNPITIDQLSMLLWAAYGVTDTRYGFRSSPSAGATYPLEIYVVVGEKGVRIGDEKYLRSGVYKYDVYTHSLRLVREGDFRDELAKAALDQPWVREAPINIVITAVFERTTRIYGERGRVRYVPMEVGHVGQNIYLMATALRLGTVVIGAFYDDWIAQIISASENETPMYIVPVGVPKEFRETTFEDIQRFIESRRG